MKYCSETVVKKGRGRPAKVYRLRGLDGQICGDTDGHLYSGHNLIPLNMPEPKSTDNVPENTMNIQSELEPKGVIMADPLSSDGIPSKPKITDKETKQTNVVEPTDTINSDHKDTKQDTLGLIQDAGTQGAVPGSDRMVAGQQPATTGEEMGLVHSTTQDNSYKQEILSGVVSKDMIPDLPVFTSEEEKIAFEETLNQIDMTQVRKLRYFSLSRYSNVPFFICCITLHLGEFQVRRS